MAVETEIAAIETPGAGTPAPADPSEAEERLQAFITDSSAMLLSEFNEDKAERKNAIEDEWLHDLRQYKGIYEPEIERQIQPNRSKAFIRITRTKVKSVDARVFDIMFPAGGDKNWAITPTPIPQVDPETERQAAIELATAKAEAMAELQQSMPPQEVEQAKADGTYGDFQSVFAKLKQGEIPPDFQPTEEEMEAWRREFCKAAAAGMEQEIDDQLDEGHYSSVMRQVMHSGHLLGTGVLKGPMTEKREVKRWGMGEDGQWGMQTKVVRRPYFEFVPVWDLYPDGTAISPEEANRIWQRYVFNRHDLRKLAKRRDFDQDAINTYIAAHPEGDAANLEYYEQQLRLIGRDSQDKSSAHRLQERRKKYVVLQRSGWLDGRELRDMNPHILDHLREGDGDDAEVPEDALNQEYFCEVWLLGSVCIKAKIIESAYERLQYYFYYFERDETNIWGVSVPSVMRDPQTMFNAAIRAMIDNAAISAGPQIEINTDLCQDENPDLVYPFRTWLREGTGVEAQYPAIRVYTLPSYTKELMNMSEMFKQLGDEATTLPSYTHGEQDHGVAKTVGGLSMLMGAANVTLKDIVRNFDDGVTKPFITAMYYWNMEWNPKDEIKGDFQTEAKGSSSLIAKELHSQRLEQFAAQTANDQDAPYIKRRNLLVARVKAQDLDQDDIVKTDKEVEQDRARMAEERAQAQAAQEQASAGAQAPQGGGQPPQGGEVTPLSGAPAAAGGQR